MNMFTFSYSALIAPIGLDVYGVSPILVGAMAMSPFYSLAFVLLLIGGLGTAAFSNMQTTLILTEAPLATRSRVLGGVTVCIGTGPLGVLAIGVLSQQLGPSAAILIMAGLGISGLCLVWTKLIEVRPR
jgi:hypothetical protein